MRGQWLTRVGTVAIVTIFLLPAPALARKGPDIVGARFVTAPVAGVPAVLMIRVRDPLAAINGLQVDFGDGSMLKHSACRPLITGAAAPPAAFAPGRPVTFPVTYVYKQAARVTVRISATAGDCVIGAAVSTHEFSVRVRGLTSPASKPERRDAPLARTAQVSVCPEAGALPGAAGLAAVKASLHCLIDVVRKAKGRVTLRPSKRLARAAQRHANDMVARSYFAHESPDGADLLKRLRRARFRPRGIAGENLAAGSGDYGTALGTLLMWLNSPPHKANLYEPSFRLGGIGVARGVPDDASDGATYVLTLAER